MVRISTIIPYKNGYALASCICGVIILIPCVGGILTTLGRVYLLWVFDLIFLVGGILSPVPIVLGFMGLSYVKKHPTAQGEEHAIIGLVFGFLGVLWLLAILAMIVVSFIRPPVFFV
jgi:hypothetical protein